MNKSGAIVLLAFSLFLCSCSLFAPSPTQIAILPIVFNVNENELDNNTYKYPEKAALEETKKLYESTFNLKFQVLNTVFTSDPLEFTCSIWAPPPRVNVEATEFINQCYERMVVLIYIHRNMSTNLLGCAPVAGILNGNATLFLYLEDSSKENSETLSHELAHIFGADHTNDGTLMSPAQSDVIVATFSDDTKDEIEEVLDLL